MKLYPSLSIVLLLFGTVLSGPLDDYFRSMYQPAFQPASAQENLAYATGYGAPDLNQPIVQSDTQETGGPDYINEIKDQVKAPRNSGGEAEIQGFQYFGNVGQGATVGLQPLYDKRNWLGCAGNPCGKASCPGLHMEGSDWTNCWGEVFRIYRASGPGNVKVGDVVGVYYPRSRRWFSLWGGTGRLATCPGNPTSAYGFATEDRWYHCSGEVFKIYARGKSLGALIEQHDEIMLYYIRDRKWVGLVGHVDLRTCPGSTRPPPLDRFEACWGEIFELWRR